MLWPNVEKKIFFRRKVENNAVKLKKKENASSQKWKKNTFFILVGTEQKDKSEQDNSTIKPTHKADENR